MKKVKIDYVFINLMSTFNESMTEQFTINIYDMFGKITKTYHPKTVSEPIHISPEESIDLIGCPIDLTVKIGREDTIVKEGATIVYDVQPYYHEGCNIVEGPFHYKLSTTCDTSHNHSEQYGYNSVNDDESLYCVSDVDISDGKIIPRGGP